METFSYVEEEKVFVSVKGRQREMDLKLFIALLLLIHDAVGVLPTLQHVHSKFEFKHSFKGPYLMNSEGLIPFWTYGGSELALGVRGF